MVEALFVGLVVGFVIYEILGISPGGVIAPGYLALYIYQPGKIGVTVVLGLVTWGILEILSSRLIIYGRRRLLVALLLGFCLKLGLEYLIYPLAFVPAELESIGYIIPGLIGNEISRQKLLPTISGLGIATICVYLVMLLIPAY